MELRECDIVMKGGITSGIVYPMAVWELSQRYRFRNVGGTSAGAIAASATAAAELGRGKPGAGFDRLSRMPSALADGGKLFSLFQPQAGTAALFALFVAWLGEGGGAARTARVLGAAWWRYAEWILGGAAPGVALLLAVYFGSDGGARVAGVAAGALLALLGSALTLAAGVLRDVTRALPANGFGACKGYDAAEETPGLITWLDAELDALAGRESGDPPLTFGDLWGARGDTVPAVDDRRINLEMITTNLTHGRPYTLPFASREFFFDPVELAAYFPPRIMTWMVAKGEAHMKEREPLSSQDGRVVLPLPPACDLPVLVATRMSLSFPFLFSAVPLYSIDRGRPDYTDDTKPLIAERCWFSDGGITRNFPVHFFDSLLPRRPTFGINLLPFTRFHPRDVDTESANVYMPKHNGAGIAEWWNRFDEDYRGNPLPGARKLLGFVLAMVNTARTWQDNALTRAPGYRDRVVHVKLAREEGGLNLTMPKAVLDRLTARGRAAGALLRRRYTERPTEPGVTISWPNHRRVRYRAAMAALSRTLKEMRRSYRHPAAGDTSYADIADGRSDDGAGAYRWKPHQRDADPRGQTERLFAVVDAWDASNVQFEAGRPRPPAELRPTPRT